MAIPIAAQYLGEKYGVDKARFRIRLAYADGRKAYKKFDTELEARAYIGRLIQQWEECPGKEG